VAHYVVAPSDVINNRLNEREKTDPRRIPRHIVDAAMSNNKHRMVDVADFADEFYLYDGESTGSKLLAKKEKGKNLEILDPKAFEYGNFEELVEDNAYFERPDTTIFMLMSSETLIMVKKYPILQTNTNSDLEMYTTLSL
jgi:hypothetical protein